MKQNFKENFRFSQIFCKLWQHATFAIFRKVSSSISNVVCFRKKFYSKRFSREIARTTIYETVFFLLFFLVYFLGGLERVGHSFDNVANFVLSDVLIGYCIASFLYIMLLNWNKKNGRLSNVYCILTINIKINIFQVNDAFAFFLFCPQTHRFRVR